MEAVQDTIVDPQAPPVEPPAQEPPKEPEQQSSMPPNQEPDADKAAKDKATQEAAEKERIEKERRQDAAFKRIIREKAEAKAEAVALRTQLERLANQPAPAGDGSPQRDQFETDLDYFEAVRAYDAKKIREEIKQELGTSQVNEQRQAHFQRIQEAKKELPDIEEVIASSQVNIGAEAVQAIMTSQYSAQIAYELAKDDEAEAMRIASLPPLARVREIGKIEAKIEAAKNKPVAPKTPSNAPNPITPLNPKGAALPKNTQEMSDAEWIEKRRKEKYHNYKP